MQAFTLARRAGYLVVLGLMMAAPSPAVTQSTQPETPEGYVPYTDPTFGFQLALPGGWNYDRSRFAGPEGAIGVLRGTAPDAGRALQVLIFRSLTLPGFDAWLGEFVERLGDAYGGRRIPRETRISAGRERVTLLVDTKTAGQRTQTYYLCVPFDANTVWVLAVAGAAADDAAAQQLRAQFDTVADSLTVLYTPLEARKMSAAFDRGLAVLSELRTAGDAIPIEPHERTYEIRIDDEPIGYFTRTIRREEHRPGSAESGAKPIPGLRVREDSWRFADDGTVRNTEINLFAAFARPYELLESRTTQVPAPDVASQRLFIQLSEGIRQGDALVCSFSTNLDAQLPDPHPPIPVGPRYLPAAWVRLLPRLLRDQPPERFAFAVFDFETRGLIIYSITPQGEAAIPGTRNERGRAYDVREGFAAQPIRLYADDGGHVVRIESGDLVFAAVPPATVEQRWRARRQAAEQRMALPTNPVLPQP